MTGYPIVLNQRELIDAAAGHLHILIRPMRKNPPQDSSPTQNDDGSWQWRKIAGDINEVWPDDDKGLICEFGNRNTCFWVKESWKDVAFQGRLYKSDYIGTDKEKKIIWEMGHKMSINESRFLLTVINSTPRKLISAMDLMHHDYNFGYRLESGGTSYVSMHDQDMKKVFIQEWNRNALSEKIKYSNNPWVWVLNVSVANKVD